MLRTADAAGADAVLLTGDSVDPYNPKCVRASRKPLPPSVWWAARWRGPAGAARRGLRVLAADGRADLDLDQAADQGLLAAPTAWVFGNEAWGCRRRPAPWPTFVVRVPIHGRAESLNLATAAAVCLYASAWAQRARVEEALTAQPVSGAIRSPVSGSVTSSVAVPPSLGLAVLVPS